MRQLFAKVGKKFTTKSFESKISVFFTLYFMFGILFAIYYALYYHWEYYGYFSPNFFMVVFTWPYQAIGFIKDILYFGPSGKPL